MLQVRCAEYQMDIFLHLAVTINLLFTGVGCLRNVTIEVPHAVTSGNTVVLICNYDLEDDLLYTVKWYKGREEFFRFVPKELPHTTVFALPGFSIDVSASDRNKVVLREVKTEMSGKYKCEVSTDAPDFHTEVVSANMFIVDPLEGEPVLEVEKNRYSLGDTLRGNCSSPPASQPTNLTWFINGNRLKPNTRVETNWSEGKRQTVTITDLELEINSFLGNTVRLQCVADLFTIYKKYSEQLEIVLVEDRPRLASVLGNRDSSGCDHFRNSYWIIPIGTLSLFWR